MKQNNENWWARETKGFCFVWLAEFDYSNYWPQFNDKKCDIVPRGFQIHNNIGSSILF